MGQRSRSSIKHKGFPLCSLLCFLVFFFLFFLLFSFEVNSFFVLLFFIFVTGVYNDAALKSDNGPRKVSKEYWSSYGFSTHCMYHSFIPSPLITPLLPFSTNIATQGDLTFNQRMNAYFGLHWGELQSLKWYFTIFACILLFFLWYFYPPLILLMTIHSPHCTRWWSSTRLIHASRCTITANSVYKRYYSFSLPRLPSSISIIYALFL